MALTEIINITIKYREGYYTYSKYVFTRSDKEAKVVALNQVQELQIAA